MLLIFRKKFFEMHSLYCIKFEIDFIKVNVAIIKSLIIYKCFIQHFQGYIYFKKIKKRNFLKMFCSKVPKKTKK